MSGYNYEQTTEQKQETRLLDAAHRKKAADLRIARAKQKSPRSYECGYAHGLIWAIKNLKLDRDQFEKLNSEVAKAMVANINQKFEGKKSSKNANAAIRAE